MTEQLNADPRRSRTDLRTDLRTDIRVMRKGAGVRIGGDHSGGNEEWVRFRVWNMRLLRGREEELFEEMVKYGLEVLGVSETKIKSNATKAEGEGMYNVHVRGWFQQKFSSSL